MKNKFKLTCLILIFVLQIVTLVPQKGFAQTSNEIGSLPNESASQPDRNEYEDSFGEPQEPEDVTGPPAPPQNVDPGSDESLPQENSSPISESVEDETGESYSESSASEEESSASSTSESSVQPTPVRPDNNQTNQSSNMHLIKQLTSTNPSTAINDESTNSILQQIIQLVSPSFERISELTKNPSALADVFLLLFNGGLNISVAPQPTSFVLQIIYTGTTILSYL